MLGGAGYSMTNQGTSGSDARTDSNAGGGFGPQSWNFGNQAFSSQGVNPWLLAGIAVVALWLLYGRKR